MTPQPHLEASAVTLWLLDTHRVSGRGRGEGHREEKSPDSLSLLEPGTGRGRRVGGAAETVSDVSICDASSEGEVALGPCAEGTSWKVRKAGWRKGFSLGAARVSLGSPTLASKSHNQTCLVLPDSHGRTCIRGQFGLLPLGWVLWAALVPKATLSWALPASVSWGGCVAWAVRVGVRREGEAQQQSGLLGLPVPSRRGTGHGTGPLGCRTRLDSTWSTA